MPGLDTRTGRRNVRKGFTTDYTPKVGYQPAKERTYGYGTVQAENPVADDGYGSMNFSSNTQSLMNQISGFQASRPQPQPQFESPSESSPVSYSAPNQNGGTGSQSDPYAMPQPQFQMPAENTPQQNPTPAPRPQGVVQNTGGNGSTNYGTTNFGTTQQYNPATRRWETVSLGPKGGY
jgi:hypothetical protein